MTRLEFIGWIMAGIVVLAAILFRSKSPGDPTAEASRNGITNPIVLSHDFLAGMYADDFYPNNLVRDGEAELLNLCRAIESTPPQTLDELYALTDQATRNFNALSGRFVTQNSDFETVAREAVAMEFHFIAESYGFEADIETLIRQRTW